jgi:hypothetical protein
MRERGINAWRPELSNRLEFGIGAMGKAGCSVVAKNRLYNRNEGRFERMGGVDG